MRIANWNNWPVIESHVFSPNEKEELPGIISENKTLVARGLGRSYGDASLGKVIVDCTGLNRILSVDIENGLLIAEAGVSLDDILQKIVPLGFFLPVVPGTKFITIGGAIAADIHGKNHHKHGTFSQHILWLELIDENRGIHRCSPQENSELFRKTCGGMGISGIIVSACICLIRIENAYIKYQYHRLTNIYQLLRAFEKQQDSTYTVAWIDTVSSGLKTGRSVLITGEHCPNNELPKRYLKKQLTAGNRKQLNVPFFFPGFFLGHFNIKLFNNWYYFRHNTSSEQCFQHFEKFFFPLDSIGNWNRLYGRNGFLQYQFVVPMGEQGEKAICHVLDSCRKHHQASFLSVLKVFGDNNPLSYMSFPEKGYTMALDLKVNKTLFDFLNTLDEIVEKAGGKLYLAKDARMSRDFFETSYTKKVRSEFFVSSLSERLGLNKNE